MDKADCFSFTKKLVRLVLLGSADFTFCSGFDLCFRTENKEKSLADFIDFDLYLTDAGFPNRTFYCNRKWRMELPKNDRIVSQCLRER